VRVVMTKICNGARLAALVLPALLAWCASAALANAQTRTFICGHGRAITVTVTGPNSISAGPIDGARMAMRKVGPQPFQFANGDYGVTITPDQNQATVEIPDYGTTVCRFRPQVSAAGMKGLGHEDPCGPGFHQVPETDACESNAGTPANAQPRPRTGTAAGRFPMPGASLGGIVRARPTQASSKIASLGPGDNVTILARDRAWDGYDWFLIRFHGRTGYQWGGIMCSQNPIRGILEQCRP
jgi:hypothetical protein